MGSHTCLWPSALDLGDRPSEQGGGDWGTDDDNAEQQGMGIIVRENEATSCAHCPGFGEGITMGDGRESC